MTTTWHGADARPRAPGLDPSGRFDRQAEAIRRAAARLGIDIGSLHRVSDRRTGVYRIMSPAGPKAGRVVSTADTLTPADVTHRVLYALGRLGAPVASPLHPHAFDDGGYQVGFWPWLQETCISSRVWGELTGAFHRAGRSLAPPLAASILPYAPGWVFGPRVRRAYELTSVVAHPLYGAAALVREFETALKSAIERAQLAGNAQGATVVIHGDNHPGNLMAGPNGPILNDVERIAVGPAAADLAALVLGREHHGYPASVEQDFRTGYAAVCGNVPPTIEQALPFARIRELSGVVFAMLGADHSDEAEREMHVRLTAIARPGTGERWTYLGRPESPHLAGLPGAAPGHSCRTVPPEGASPTQKVRV